MTPTAAVISPTGRGCEARLFTSLASDPEDANNLSAQQRTLAALAADRLVCEWNRESDDVLSLLELDNGSDGFESLRDAGADSVEMTKQGQRVSDGAHASVATLMALAARTYAPMTDESREKGAGAGTSDND